MIADTTSRGAVIGKKEIYKTVLEANRKVVSSNLARHRQQGD